MKKRFQTVWLLGIFLAGTSLFSIHGYGGNRSFVHEDGHEIHLPSLMEFFSKHFSLRNDHMKFLEDKEKGLLTARDNEKDVLTYRSGDQLKEGVDPKQTRSCYIHPAGNISRSIDLELKIQAKGGSLTLQGAPDQNKGYGGRIYIHKGDSTTGKVPEAYKQYLSLFSKKL